MRNLNQDLQATHKMISVLEKSKFLSDDLLDMLPGILVTINKDGQILKGNLEAGKILGIDHEYLLEKPFSHYFKKETWHIFEANLDNLSRNCLEKVEFELPLDSDLLSTSRSFFWQVKSYQIDNSVGKEGGLFSIIGTDITELRSIEGQLLEIFSTIPLGILTTDDKGIVQKRYSAFAEFLLRTSDIAGKNFKDLLFGNYWEELGPFEKEGLENLSFAFGESELFFDKIKDSLPKQSRVMYFEDNELKEMWLGLTFKGIFYEGKLRQLLILIEDNRKIVLLEKEKELSQIIYDQTIERIVHLKKADPYILPMIIDEIGELIHKLESAKNENNLGSMGRLLHTLKGNARIGGLQRLTSLVHWFEQKLRKNETFNNNSDEFLNWDFIQESYDEILSEWKEVKSVYQVLFKREEEDEKASSRKEGNADSSVEDAELVPASLLEIKKIFKRYNELLQIETLKSGTLLSDRLVLSIQSLTYSPLQSIESFLKAQISKTASNLGKEVEIHFEWNDTVTDERSKKKIRDCLIHLLNNALAHGIEPSVERKKLGKRPTGTINVRTRETGGIIYCDVEDDGHGLNLEKIKARAIQDGHLALEDSFYLSETEILNFIFRPNMSTSDKIDQISGRGVGLDVVADIVEISGGKISVANNRPHGAVFSFSLRNTPDLPFERTCVPYSDFINLLQASLLQMNEKEGFAIKLVKDGMDHDLARNFLYINLEKINLALTTLVGQFSGKREACVKIGHEGEKLQVQMAYIEKDKKGKKHAPLEYVLPGQICEGIIIKHDGKVLNDSDHSKCIIFGHIIPSDHLPTLKIGIGEGLNLLEEKDNLKKSLGIIESILKEMNLKYEFDLKNEKRPNIFLVNSTQHIPYPHLQLSEIRDEIREGLLISLGQILNFKGKENLRGNFLCQKF